MKQRELFIRVVRRNGAAIDPPIEAEFDTSGGIIGRNESSKLWLDDETREVSSRHAKVSWDQGRFFIMDTSTNGTYVLDHSTGSPKLIEENRWHELLEGDLLFICDYELEVRLAGLPADRITKYESSPDATQRSDTDMRARKEPTVPESMVHESTAVEPNEDRPPDGSRDDQAPPPRPEPERHPARAERRDEAPPPRAEPAASPPRPEPERQPARAASDDDLLAAFLDGAGLDPTRVVVSDPARFMQEAGGMFYDVVDGLIGLLAARTEFKNTFGLDDTSFRSGKAGYNPLKSAGGPKTAIRALLVDDDDDSISGRAAARQALDNVAEHELCAIAGFYAALRGIIDKFEAGQLEERLGPPAGLLGSPGRGRWWKSYQDFHQRLEAEVADGLRHSEVGRVFAKAYHARLNELKQQRADAEGLERRRAAAAARGEY